MDRDETTTMTAFPQLVVVANANAIVVAIHHENAVVDLNVVVAAAAADGAVVDVVVAVYFDLAVHPKHQ